MAVTHADLSLHRRKTDLGSKWGTFLMVFSLLCGLSAFISCLVAETMRSEATWVLSNTEKGRRYECVYSGSGKAPLLCGVSAFLMLAVAMIIENSYIFVAVNKSYEATIPPVIAWTSNSSSTSSLRLQAAFYFIGAWICFAVGEVLLIIGIGVESSHLNKWRRVRPSCLVIRPGLFAAAGVFAITTMFFAAALHLTVSQMQRIQENEENIRWEIVEASILYASPARSPRNSILPAGVPESSLDTEENQLPQAYQSEAYLDKPSNSL